MLNLKTVWMKKLYLTLFIALVYNGASAQGFSMDDLVSLTSFTSSKFDNYVSKKGYRNAGIYAGSDSLAYTYFDKKAKELQPEMQILKCDKEDKATIAYQTTAQDEFDRLCKQLQQDGYAFSRQKDVPLYQKGNISIKTATWLEGEKPVYSFIVEKKNLPHPSAVRFAEDFLQITSHEYLVYVFGAANVKKDVFYFSEDEMNNCSVLFPNTGMQVIFIWQDEASRKDIDFLLIGGQVRAEGSFNYHKQVELNAWQSRDGIRSGMTLQELQDLNGQPIMINGWDSKQPGVVAETNKGKIDFKKVGVVLNCLDCNEDRYYSNNSLINSTKLLAQNRRVYVSTLVILPQRQ